MHVEHHVSYILGQHTLVLSYEVQELDSDSRTSADFDLNRVERIDRRSCHIATSVDDPLRNAHTNWTVLQPCSQRKTIDT